MLTASERVSSIREISKRLATEEWPLIDLTLRQFKAPLSNVWGGDKLSYIVEMLSNVDDEILSELSEHIGCGIIHNHSDIHPSFWKQNHFKLFISHLSSYRSYAAELQDALFKYQISSFVAHNDIEPAVEWEDEILLSLSTADAAVALLHDQFHSSKWTDQECGYALGRGLLCIAVSYGEIPYGFLGRFQALNANGKDVDALATDIFHILLSNKNTKQRMAECLLSRLEMTGSFADAKRDIMLVEKIPFWDDRFFDILKRSLSTNHQISGAFGVPEKINHLISIKSELKNK